MMNWLSLLNPGRLCGKRIEAGSERTAFQVDYDRIVFSASFRRLQDKTQVFPLSGSDFVRTRLTHSLEASCVGRSLGTQIGGRLIAEHPELRTVFHPSETGAVVAAACLAHDIGNPPFGHAGEKAIAHWFKHAPFGCEIISSLKAEGAPIEDFTRFEGNAQGFRVLSRLEYSRNPGGLQLTHPVLAAFMKYPQPSGLEKIPERTSTKKYGFFGDDRGLYLEVANSLGIPSCDEGCRFYRHPLAFLVEAADDICYHVIDLEDGWKMGRVDFDEVMTLLLAVSGLASTKIPSRLKHDREGTVGFLRSVTINALVGQCVDVFIDNEEALLNGEFDAPLTENIKSADTFTRLKDLEIEKVYSGTDVISIEAAGFSVLEKLIEIFLSAVEDAASGSSISARSKTFLKLFPNAEKPYKEMTLYQRVLSVTDYVSSLSDRTAVSLFKRFTGISLPGE